MMSKNYHRQPNDTVTVHQDVLRTLIRTAAQNVDGIVQVGQSNTTIDRLLSSEHGVHLDVEDDLVTVNVSLVADGNANLTQASRRVQDAISRTLRDYVGWRVQAVNVHIEDVIFEDAQ